MEFNLETLAILATIVLTGLSAGLCFTWTNAITPGIGELNDFAFIQAFQAMNRTIQNPAFFVVFFGPFFGNLLNVYLKRGDNSVTFWLLVIASGLYILGVVFITIFKNVPLNEILESSDLLSMTEQELKALRNKFETPWKQWHFIRTLTSIGSFSVLLIALILNK